MKVRSTGSIAFVFFFRSVFGKSVGSKSGRNAVQQFVRLNSANGCGPLCSRSYARSLAMRMPDNEELCARMRTMLAIASGAFAILHVEHAISSAARLCAFNAKNKRVQSITLIGGPHRCSGFGVLFSWIVRIVLYRVWLRVTQYCLIFAFDRFLLDVCVLFGLPEWLKRSSDSMEPT